MNPNQRDPDDIGLLRILRDGLDDLTRLVTARWGRVPYMSADPTSPADGSMWIRSDTATVSYRVAGVTYPAWTSTTAALAAIGNTINTAGKYAGRIVFNTTTSKPVWAVGSTAGAVWVDATGATVHTPI